MKLRRTLAFVALATLAGCFPFETAGGTLGTAVLQVAGGISPQTAGGVTPQTASGIAPQTASGITPQAASGVTPQTASGDTPRTAGLVGAFR